MRSLPVLEPVILLLPLPAPFLPLCSNSQNSLYFLCYIFFKRILWSRKVSLFYTSEIQGTEKTSKFPMTTQSVSGAVTPRNLIPFSVLSTTMLHSITHAEHGNGPPSGAHHQNWHHTQEEYPKVGFIKLEQGMARHLREWYQIRLCSYYMYFRLCKPHYVSSTEIQQNGNCLCWWMWKQNLSKVK